MHSLLSGVRVEPRPVPRIWRRALTGTAHLYRSEHPRAFPSCGAPLRYQDSAPVQGPQRAFCRHCSKRLDHLMELDARRLSDNEEDGDGR